MSARMDLQAATHDDKGYGWTRKAKIRKGFSLLASHEAFQVYDWNTNLVDGVDGVDGGCCILPRPIQGPK